MNTSFEMVFPEPRLPETVQAMATQGVAAYKDLYARTAAATEANAKTMSEIADVAWSNSRVLNDKLAQNFTINADAAFNAAQAISAASSLSEIAQLHCAFLRQLMIRSADQTKEFLDLSSQATQRLLDRGQSAAKSVPSSV